MRPTLSTLTYVSNTVPARRTVMEHVRTNLSQLKEFTCSNDSLYLYPADALVDDFSDTILALNNLTKCLNASSMLRPDAVLHLSRIPHLSILGVSIKNKNRDLWTNPHSGGFPALTHLILSVYTKEDGLSLGVQMLRTLSGLALTNLQIDLSVPSIRAEEYVDLISAIGRLRLLRDCQIVGSRLVGEPAHAAHAIDASALTPLHALSDMRHFHQMSIPVAFQPESARQLAAAWPRLEELSIRASSGERRLYRELRRNDLLALARSCPSAEALAVAAHPVRENRAYDASAVEHAPSAPNQFGLGGPDSSIRIVDGVALRLGQIFSATRLEDDWVEVERPDAE
ncbi:hypothetical protein PsYK624_034220 [Phanerochaete sordida]|uniref:RNI-like protein n=1 Tax=Phanerochaete sordida TaxID=48140 RepID=A0A9P3LAA4_9APHY|nr:hypothetical protein PsYK624_034220 [Phanerochaete sordida]